MSYGDEQVSHNLSLLRSGKMGGSFSFEEHYALEHSGQQAPSFAELQAQERAAVEKAVSDYEQDFANRHVQPQVKEYLDNGAPNMPFTYPLVPPHVKEAAEAAKRAAQPEPDYAEMQRLEVNRSGVPVYCPPTAAEYAEDDAPESYESDKTLIEVIKEKRGSGPAQIVRDAVSQRKHTNPLTGEFQKNLAWGYIFGSEKEGDHFHVTVPDPPTVREIVMKAAGQRENFGHVHGTFDADRKHPERVFGPESGSLEGRIEVNELKQEGQLERRVHVGSWEPTSSNQLSNAIRNHMNPLKALLK